MVATNEGRLREIFFNPQKGNFLDALGCFEGITAVSGYYADVDQRQHVIVATQSGDVYEVWFDQPGGVHSALLRRIPGAMAVAGFYSADDQFQHAIVATRSGQVQELFWRPAQGVGQTVIGNFTNIVAVAGFWAPDDLFRIVHVATADGALHEIFYHPVKGRGQSVIGSFPGVVGVGSFYSGDDQFRHALVATRDGNVSELFYHPQKGRGQSVLSNFGGVVSVSGYFTPNDGYRHAIVGDAAGNVHELFYSPKTGKGRSVLRTFSEAPAVEDISPDTDNGTVNDPGSGGTTAGVIVGLEGDESALYAVSQNAGIWKSWNGNAWVQLVNSPPRAFSLAIDPNNSQHLISGERDGDARAAALNRSGVWESLNGGATWSYIFNPYTQAGCRGLGSQAIAAAAFSKQSTELIATPCGVGRRKAGQPTFTFDAVTQAAGAITGVTASKTKVWARTASALFVSVDDGATWQPTAPLPSGVIFAGRNTDQYSLAAFDFAAYMISMGDETPDLKNHYANLLTYNAAGNSWTQKRINFKGEGTRDGTGLGGRRFIRAYELDRQDLPAVMGKRLQLFVSLAQEVYRATQLLPDNSLDGWERPAGASGGGLSNQDPVHSDFWSFHFSPKGGTAWLGNDGGVFRETVTDTGAFTGGGWQTQNQGLHTHHAHTLTVISPGRCGSQHVAYATSDNDAWARGDQARWLNPQVFGDANWTDGDAGNAGIALLSRNHEEPWLTGFGQNLPNGAPWQQFALNKDLTLDSGAFPRYPIRFIQTLQDENPSPALDAVLVQRKPLGNPDPSGELVLLRNRNFANGLDKNDLLFKNWPVEVTNLPPGASGFWVAGGHAAPVYYALAAGVVYKRTAAWTPLSVSGILDSGAHGPLYVNPYNANQLIVLTSAGVQISSDGGATFRIDDVLTALLTASGKYPLTAGFAGTNLANTPLWNHEISMGTLSDVAFNRFNPAEVAVSSPFTGVFYTNGDGRWRTLSGVLPTPRTAVSALAMNCEALYAATEGRSIVRAVNYRNAPLGTFFETLAATGPGTAFARLVDAAKNPITAASADVLFTNAAGADLFTGPLKSDAQGRLLIPNGIAAGSYTVHIHFAGSGAAGPAETSVAFSF